MMVKRVALEILLLIVVNIVLVNAEIHSRVEREDGEARSLGSMLNNLMSKLFGTKPASNTTTETQPQEETADEAIHSDTPDNSDTGQDMNNEADVSGKQNSTSLSDDNSEVSDEEKDEENKTVTSNKTTRAEVDFELSTIQTTETTTTTIPYADMSTSTTTRTTTTSGTFWPIPEEPEACYVDPFLEKFCSVPEDLKGVSFWDLYSLLFSDAVLDTIMMECTKGEWCLRDRFDYWDALIAERVDMVLKSDISATMCENANKGCISSVPDNYKNCSIYEIAVTVTVSATSSQQPTLDTGQNWLLKRGGCCSEVSKNGYFLISETTFKHTPSEESKDADWTSHLHCLQMEFASESISLICRLKQNPALSTDCYERTLQALHVTLADILRGVKGGDETVTQAEDICNSPEEHMTRAIICIVNSCPSEPNTFRSFAPWSWFTNVVDDLIDQCNLNTAECEGLLQVGETSTVTSTTTVSSVLYTSTMSSVSYTSTVSSVAKTNTTNSTTPGMDEMMKNMMKDHGSMAWMHDYDSGMVLGITVVTVTTLLVTLFIGFTYWRRYRRSLVLKEGYQQLLNEGEES